MDRQILYVEVIVIDEERLSSYENKVPLSPESTYIIKLRPPTNKMIYFFMVNGRQNTTLKLY